MSGGLLNSRKEGSVAMRLAAGIGHFVLSILSLMVLSSFAFGFGFFGLLAAYAAPWLGNLTLVPAALGGCATTTCMRMWFRWFMKHSMVTTNALVGDLPGQLAEVNIPIAGGNVGEITYVVNSKRLCSSAKCRSGVDLKKGAKVVIIQAEDHLLYVEPCDL
jgi:membrane protein implicated in regulation of membrane protease activity